MSGVCVRGLLPFAKTVDLRTGAFTARIFRPTLRTESCVLNADWKC